MEYPRRIFPLILLSVWTTAQAQQFVGLQFMPSVFTHQGPGQPFQNLQHYNQFNQQYNEVPAAQPTSFNPYQGIPYFQQLTNQFPHVTETPSSNIQQPKLTQANQVTQQFSHVTDSAASIQEPQVDGQLAPIILAFRSFDETTSTSTTTTTPKPVETTISSTSTTTSPSSSEEETTLPMTTILPSSSDFTSTTTTTAPPETTTIDTTTSTTTISTTSAPSTTSTTTTTTTPSSTTSTTTSTSTSTSRPRSPVTTRIPVLIAPFRDLNEKQIEAKLHHKLIDCGLDHTKWDRTCCEQEELLWMSHKRRLEVQGFRMRFNPDFYSWSGGFDGSCKRTMSKTFMFEVAEPEECKSRGDICFWHDRKCNCGPQFVAKETYRSSSYELFMDGAEIRSLVV